ncbi:unnamed protein product [Brachionus calyciflorus]|uniref:General transcription factor 3C polypeptide 5 n=1 Tax=Brachionus calyciflorus TaxID=104777 RepID=A0A813NPH4_9BILA|nr:unnamed protein product [Brachionus calyciflorus]
MESIPKSSLKTFMCIDYPGLVKNEHEAIRTLGGMDRITQSFSRKNCNLLLNFTPDNIFSKSLCSNQIDDPNESQYSSTQASHSDIDEPKNEVKNESTNNPVVSSSRQTDFVPMPCLVMKVKILKNAKKPQVEIIGKVKRVYNFNKMADFQYLPMNSSNQRIQNENTQNLNQFTYNAFYDNFLFTNIQSYDHEFRKNQLNQLFILPPFFSRFDDPVSYSYRSEPSKRQILEQVKEINKELNGEAGQNSELETSLASSPQKKSDNQKEESNDLIRSMRQERSSQAILVPFKSPTIPEKPSDKLKPVRTELIRECIGKLTEMFKERPCYLKSVLLCVTNYPASLLKEVLPYVAYYFTTGPWRSCWVRFGYDPRKHPEARKYQMIDYRLRNTAEPEHIVKTKPRPSYHKRKFRR